MALVLEGYPALKGRRTEVGRPDRSIRRCLLRGKKVYAKALVLWQVPFSGTGKKGAEKHQGHFLIVLEARGWKSKIKVPAWSVF